MIDLGWQLQTLVMHSQLNLVQQDVDVDGRGVKLGRRLKKEAIYRAKNNAR